MRHVVTAYSVVASLGFTVLLITSFQHTRDSEGRNHTSVETEEENVLPQVIRSVALNKTYSFAGEALPKDNFDALERLDRELSVNSYWHSSTLLNIKSAARYFPIIEPILKENGIPDDFKYLAVIESNLRNVTSPAGAKGIWQFIKNTGSHYGLEINGEVDERYNIEKATEAACAYLRDYHEQFQSWTLAAAAFNMGGPRLRKTLEEQHATSYYDININEETSRYVLRIIAMKEILSDPKAYGFYVEKEQLYEPLEYRTVSVSGSIPDLAVYAEENGISYRMLKVYNPWLIDGSLTNSGGKEYVIKLPAS